MKYSLSLLSPLLLAIFGVLKTKAFTTPSTPKVVSSTVAKDSLTSLKASTSNLYNIERYRGTYGGWGDYYPYGGGYNDYYYGNSYLPYYNNYNGYGGGYSTSLLARSPQADWYSPTRNSYYGNYYNNDWNRYGGYGGYGSNSYYGNGYYGSGYGGYGNGYYGNNWGYNGFLRPNNPDLSEKSPSLLNQADNMGYHGNFGEPRNAFARQYNRDMYYGMGYGGMGYGYGRGGWGGNGYYNNGYYGNGYGSGYGYGGGYGGGYYNDYNRYQNTGYNY